MSAIQSDLSGNPDFSSNTIAATAAVEICKIDKDKISSLEDLVIVEFSLGLFVNQKRLVNLLCSPMDLRELVLGYLLGEGLIHALQDVASLRICADSQKAFVALRNKDAFSLQGGEMQAVRTLTSACGKQHSIAYALLNDVGLPILADGFALHHATISDCVNRFNKQSPLFLATGGVHSCALYAQDTELCFFEDIGRHNAFDKCMGYALLREIDLRDCMVLTSGRVPSDLVMKSIQCNLPILVSRSAPTDQAILLARAHNLTVIGFARAQKMNVYSAVSRVIT